MVCLEILAKLIEYHSSCEFYIFSLPLIRSVEWDNDCYDPIFNGGYWEERFGEGIVSEVSPLR